MKDYRCFTLIEMLVVVAVIAVLMALLAPALQKARDSAYGVSCIGNMRQIAAAANGYVVDNHGWTPGPHIQIDLGDDRSKDTNKKWVPMYAPYAGIDNNEMGISSWIKGTIFDCPSTTTESNGWGFESSNYGHNYKTGAGGDAPQDNLPKNVRESLSGESNIAWAVQQRAGVIIRRLAKPGKTLWIGDSSGQSVLYYTDRHYGEKAGNVLFYDSSIGQVPKLLVNYKHEVPK